MKHETIRKSPRIRYQTTNPRSFQKKQGEVHCHIDLDKILHQSTGWHIRVNLHNFLGVSYILGCADIFVHQ